MIVSAGYNIAGPEVEGALLLHPAVAECGVVGVADDERGQIVKAFVVLKPDDRGGCRDHARAAGSRQTDDRALQVSARDRISGGAAAHRNGQAATGEAAPAGTLSAASSAELALAPPARDNREVPSPWRRRPPRRVRSRRNECPRSHAVVVQGEVRLGRPAAPDRSADRGGADGARRGARVRAGQAPAAGDRGLPSRDVRSGHLSGDGRARAPRRHASRRVRRRRAQLRLLRTRSRARSSASIPAIVR